MAQRGSYAKCWCFTYNHPHISANQLLVALSDWGLDYGVFQEEEAPSTNTRHFQGYLEFKKKVRVTTLKKLRYGRSMHFEPRRGTREQARDYCMKEDSRVDGPHEFGVWEPTRQGKRSDLLVACETVKRTMSLVEVADADPVSFVRYNRGLQKLINIQTPTRAEPPEVSLLFGPPGCGKTRSIRDMEEPDNLWVAPPGCAMQWFDDYQNQEACLFDDFDGKMSKVPLSSLLQILDRYAIRVAIKGAFVWWTPRRIYVTTNYHPLDWYDWNERRAQYGALYRRFTHVFYWRDDDTLPRILLPSDVKWERFWNRDF